MIAVDTNVLVRFLTQDDPVQYQQSVQLFTDQDIFLADTVVLETEWVLRYAYGFAPEAITAAFRKLFGLPNVFIRDADGLVQALDWHEAGLDFADALHLALAVHCSQLVTFDRRFIGRAKEILSYPVVAPE